MPVYKNENVKIYVWVTIYVHRILLLSYANFASIFARINNANEIMDMVNIRGERYLLCTVENSFYSMKDFVVFVRLKHSPTLWCRSSAGGT